MDYESLLGEIGLTKGEVKVYLTLLKLGQTTTGKIIEGANISSGKVYQILDKLIKKGLVSFILKEKTKYFLASDPSRILDYLMEREIKHRKQENDLKRILPQLKALQCNSEEKYEATIYKGLRGIETVAHMLLDYINKGDTLLAIGITSKKDKKFNILWQKWNMERIKRKKYCKFIFSDRGDEHYAILRKLPFTEVRVIEGFTPAAVDVVGDKTLIFTHEEPSCLLITSKDIAASFKQFFEQLWKIAKP
jgi:sugar-specific transcriptional regulator TrmB